MARAAFLFPGLGAYSAGMLRQARRQHPQVDQVFDEMDELAAQEGLPSPSEALFGDEPRSLEEMQAQFPAPLLHLTMFGASLATHRILIDQGVRPYVLVGHSFGEIAALVAGGAFDLAAGVRLVCARARVLEPWEGQGAMAAVGASAAVVGHILGALDDPEVVIACLNAPGQTVVSGPVAALNRAEAVARALDLFFTPLYLPYASHHPAMRPAVADFVRLTADLVQAPLVHPIYSPVHGRRYTDDDDLRQRLAECLVLPVRFLDAVRRLHEQRVTTFIEVGALRALTRCVEATVPGVDTIAPLLMAEEETSGLEQAVRSATGRAAERSARPALAHVRNGGQTRERRPVPVHRPAATNGRAPGLISPAPRAPAHPRPLLSTDGMVEADRARSTGEVSREASSVSAGAVPASRAQVLEKLRGLYAAALEYPPEVLTEDAALEAELGVDSLKQIALLTRVADLFGLPAASGPVRGLDFPTLGHVADHILRTTAAAR
jgi:[acyl-carrier-protein] S-malonyltransferase